MNEQTMATEKGAIIARLGRFRALNENRRNEPTAKELRVKLLFANGLYDCPNDHPADDQDDGLDDAEDDQRGEKARFGGWFLLADGVVAVAVLDHGDDEVGVEAPNLEMLGPAEQFQAFGVGQFPLFDHLFHLMGERGERRNIRPDRLHARQARCGGIQRSAGRGDHGVELKQFPQNQWKNPPLATGNDLDRAARVAFMPKMQLNSQGELRLMNKWIKRLLVAAITLGVVLAVLAVVGWRLMRGVPDWYQPLAMSAEQRNAAARSATNKLALLQNRAAMARADEQVARLNPQTSPTTQSEEITITFSDDELNALLSEWSVWQSVRSSYEKYLKDPYVLMKDGRFILAGRIEELDAVASLHFEPTIDSQGRLQVKLARVLAGRLPLPTAAMSNYQKQAASAIARRLPTWRQRASIDGTGIANNDAVSVVLAELLMDVLGNQSSDPVVFMEVLSRGMMPVKLTGIRIEDHSLTLTVRPMNVEERTALLQHIRENPPTAAAQ